jgi:hypothetical protein
MVSCSVARRPNPLGSLAVSPSSLADLVAQRGLSVDLKLLAKVLDLCGPLDRGLISGHFARVRNPARYFRDFAAEQVAEHLRLLGELNEQSLVVVSTQPAAEGAIEIVVAGVDLMGVTACVAGCLAEMGLLITQLDVITYEASAPAAGDVVPADVSAATAAPAVGLTADRYVMSIRVLPQRPITDSQAMVATLRARLKAAYWHLIRGDVNKARHASDDQDELTGQTIDGRFRLERFLGQGGMGAIYLATQLDLLRPVAIKLLRPEFSPDDRSYDHFQRESRLLAQVHSPHVVHVYAAGRFKERAWMALEYLAGGDVAHWIGRHGAPAVDLAVRWLRDALAGLYYIHRDVGIIHHDIKPHNLLLDAGQNLRISDLGLGLWQRQAELAEADGSIRGTLWYMSPEQARGERTDERSDLFSLGSTFYHIVSGTRPYEASTPAEVLARVARADHLPLADSAPETPAPLAVVIDRLMRPHPLARYQDAGVALADLDSYLSRGRLDGCGHAAPTELLAQTANLPFTPDTPRRRRLETV